LVIAGLLALTMEDEPAAVNYCGINTRITSPKSTPYAENLITAITTTWLPFQQQSWKSLLLNKRLLSHISAELGNTVVIEPLGQRGKYCNISICAE